MLMIKYNSDTEISLTEMLRMVAYSIMTRYITNEKADAP